MFTKLKPKAELQDLFERGTDLTASPRFLNTLKFNNFNKQGNLFYYSILNIK